MAFVVADDVHHFAGREQRGGEGFSDLLAIDLISMLIYFLVNGFPV